MSRKIFFHAALLLTAAAFVWLFSYSTSPHYDFLGGDSSIFQSVGKIWAEGFLPYVDAFEHKGPLLFLINAVGYAIAPRVGLLVPQIIFLYVALLFMWRAMSLYSSSAWRIFFMALAIIFYAVHYEEGNHVEEYSIAFTAVAAYFFMRGLKANEFPPIIGLVHGIGFGACLMIRLSDAAQICCQIFLLAIFLLRDGEFKLLRKIFLNFCAGVAIVVVPFVVYFAAHGALYEMLYGTLLFNTIYAVDATFHPELTVRIFYSLQNFFPLFVLLTVSIFAHGRLKICAAFMSAAMLAMLINLRCYLHYSMIIFPMMPLLFAVLCEIQPATKKLFGRLILKTLIIFSVIHFALMGWYLELLLRGSGNVLYPIFPAYDKRTELINSDEHKKIFKLAALIPADERNSFVTHSGVFQAPRWILFTGIKSRERFFMNNSHLESVDPAIRREWFGNVRKNLPKWILYGMKPDRKLGDPIQLPEEDAELEQLLAEKYSDVGEYFCPRLKMHLYRLKE